MKTPIAGSQLPLVMLQKLHEIRGKDRSVRLWTLLLRGVAILLGLMLLAMGADWLVVLYETHSRWSLTLATLGIGVVIFILWGLPLLRT